MLLVLATGCKSDSVDVPFAQMCEEFKSLGHASGSLPKTTWDTLKVLHQGVTQFGLAPSPGSLYQYRPLHADREKIWTGELLARLGDLGPGKTKIVADIGTGGGYLAFRLAPRSSRVYAQDVDASALAYTATWGAIIQSMAAHKDKKVRERVADLSTAGIIYVEGTTRESALLPGSLDTAYMAHVYASIHRSGSDGAATVSWLLQVGKAIKSGGRLVIIEDLGGSGLSEGDLAKQGESAGFDLLDTVHPSADNGTTAFVFKKKSLALSRR